MLPGSLKNLCRWAPNWGSIAIDLGFGAKNDPNSEAISLDPEFSAVIDPNSEASLFDPQFGAHRRECVWLGRSNLA